MWQPRDNDSSFSSSSNQGNEERLQVSSSQEDESNEYGLWEFQKCYVKDYVDDKEGRLEGKDKEYKEIYIRFKFQKSSLIPNIRMYQSLEIHNLWQLISILNHYYDHDQSNVLDPITDHLKYKDLQKKINRRKTSQLSIDKRIDELSKYLTFTFKFSSSYTLTYINLNRSTLPLAISHLQSILLVLRIWSYQDSDNEEMGRIIIEISKQCNDVLLTKSLQTYHTDNLLYLPDLPLTMFRINLKFTLNLKEYSFKRILHIKHVEQFKMILNYRIFTFYEPSSRYKDLDPDIIYRNTLQSCINEVLSKLTELFNFHRKNEYDSLTLSFDYIKIVEIAEKITEEFQFHFIIKYLELLILTFKTWNDNENDRNAVNLYLLAVKNRFLPLIKKGAPDYMDMDSNYYNNTLQLNLHIILKQYQNTIIKTLKLEKPDWFINLLNYHNLLPNGYLPSSNTFDESLYNLLYIFEEDKDNPDILNLYYYPLSNDLDISIITRHLKIIISYFKTFIQEFIDIDITINDDINTLNQYLSSINFELKTSTTSSPSLSSIPSTQSPSLSSKPSNTFWYPYNPTDPITVLPSSLTLHLRLLPFDNLTLKDTLHFQDTSRFLSILNHYSLTPNTFDHPNTNDFKVFNSIKTQKDIDTTLLDLSNRILFSYDKFSNNPNLHLTYSNLKSKDIPSALLHLELMIKVFKTWSYDRHGKKVLDDFVAKVRSTIIPNIPYDDEVTVSSMITTLPTDRDHPTVLGPLVPMDPSGPTEVKASDGNLGGASANFPNLLDLAGEDISMMGDVD